MAKVFLIPVPIADGALHTLSTEVSTVTKNLKHYFVENTRTARRFLRSLHADLVIEDIHFSEISKHDGPDISQLKKWIKEGVDVGIMSESGCPGIADPGAKLVAAAHDGNASIIPLTGPSSITLALMASGLNGQSFSFHGYLPVKNPERSKKIKQLEQLSKNENQTQIFIETPYRNNKMFEDLVKSCNSHTRLCIAQNITGDSAFIATKSINEWSKKAPELPKEPAIFLVLA